MLFSHFTHHRFRISQFRVLPRPPVVTHKRVKLCDPLLNLSKGSYPEAVGGGICDGFVHDNFQLEVVGDVISSVDVE